MAGWTGKTVRYIMSHELRSLIIGWVGGSGYNCGLTKTPRAYFQMDLAFTVVLVGISQEIKVVFRPYHWGSHTPSGTCKLPNRVTRVGDFLQSFLGVRVKFDF